MFYDVYKKLCDEQGKDPYSVPLKVGYKSNSVVAQWAAGSVPRGKYLNALALFFNVSVPYLLDMDKKEPATQTGDGLDDLQKQAFDLIKKIPTEQLQTVIGVLKAILGES